MADDIFDKYPKAFGAFQFTQGRLNEMFEPIAGVDGTEAIAKRIMKLIDKCIDGSDAEKEALMITTFFRYAPLELVQNFEDFDTIFSPETQQLAAGLSVLENKDGTPSELGARIDTVVAVATVVEIGNIYRRNPVDVTLDQLGELANGYAECEKSLLPYVNAERLVSAFNVTCEDFTEMVQNISQPRNPAPSNPGGPSI